ncbi:uncharacterized protein LOC141601092 [Silene latifolia]|uniref:uncharacterized protein LOC141601092 n=1 Tax=Silene latifolia TaxID=37657 RepID=UPI003D775C1A
MKEAARGNPTGVVRWRATFVKKDVIENVEQHSNNGGGNVDVVGRAEITPGDPSTECTGNEIPLTFMSTADLNEAFAGVEERTIGAAKEGLVVEIRDARVEPVAPLPPPIYVPRCDMIHHPFLLHSTAPLPCMDIVPENLGCSQDCGAPDPDQHVCSQWLRFNKERFRTVFRVRKDVMDYVFDEFHDHKKSEQLVTYPCPNCITRIDLQSLMPGKQILGNVIDCWSVLLNQLTHANTAAVSTSRCFFGLSHAALAIEIWQGRKKNLVVDHSEGFCYSWDTWQESCTSPFQLDSDMVSSDINIETFTYWKGALFS